MKWTEITDQALDEMILKIKNEHPLCGEVSIIGFLRAKMVIVQRQRIRESIHRVDPTNAFLRWIHQNRRWVYSVPGPNSLWHNDGVHKLIHWGLIIHCCIDGYSRLATSLLCASNNLPETALAGFLSGVEQYGLPSRVRGDRGGENKDILLYMRRQQGYDGAYIQGPSVHNQRIERLNYDTNHCVLSYFIDLFLFMEEHGVLDRSSELDLYSLHYVFIPRIQRSLNEFREGWNHHPLSTAGNKSPYQLWIEGMMDKSKEEQRGVRTYLNSLDDPYYGVEPLAYDDDNELDGLVCVDVQDIHLETSDNLQNELNEHFDPLEDDSNHGINIFTNVRNHVRGFFQ